MTILFHVDGRAYRLEPDGWRAGPDRRAVRLHPAAAARLVERHFYGETGTLRLRALVGARRYDVQHWSDHDVRAEAVGLVAGGEWAVWPAPAAPAGATRWGAAAAAASGGAAPASASASAPRSAARPPAPVPLPAAPADAGPDWPAQVHQDAFAAVLEDAARTGVPFCEICA